MIYIKLQRRFHFPMNGDKTCARVGARDTEVSSLQRECKDSQHMEKIYSLSPSLLSCHALVLERWLGLELRLG